MAADDVVDASSRRPSITGGVGGVPSSRLGLVWQQGEKKKTSG
jgi:hypothetical protein